MVTTITLVAGGVGLTATALLLILARRAPSMPTSLNATTTTTTTTRLAGTPVPTRSQLVTAAAEAYLQTHPDAFTHDGWWHPTPVGQCPHTTRTTTGRLLGCVMGADHPGGHYMKTIPTAGAGR